MKHSTKFLEQRLERLAAEHPELRKLYELHKLRSNFSGLEIELEKEGALIKKLDASSYTASVAAFAERVLEVAPDEGLREIIKEMKKKPGLATELLKNVLKQSSFAPPAKIDAELLEFVLKAPLLGAFKKLAAKLPENLQARNSCPVCSTKFTLGVYNQRKRCLLCKNCEARVSAEILKCPACGNGDSRKLGFVKLEGEPQFQIDCCSECGFYIKAVDEDALGRVSDAALLDLATLDLDALAKERGLKQRHDGA